MLFWRGFINRRDLIDQFGISPPQATNDLVHYSTRNPGGCQYNVRKKRYEAPSNMNTVLISPDFGRDMEWLGASVWPEEGGDFIASVDAPARVIRVDLARKLCRAAHRRESLEVRYWSVASGTAKWRRISPRTFGFDGHRWHVRAFCHERERFGDFNVGRMKGCRKGGECPFRDRVDEDWNAMVRMVVTPHPNLAEAQKQAIAMDYGMRQGELRFPVRRAMLVYAARRLGFIKPFEGRPDLPMANELGELLWRDLVE